MVNPDGSVNSKFNYSQIIINDNLIMMQCQELGASSAETITFFHLSWYENYLVSILWPLKINLNSKGNLGGKLRSLLRSRNAYDVVQGPFGDGMHGHRAAHLVSELEFLDGRDAAELLGPVGVVLGPGPGHTRPGPPLGPRTTGQLQRNGRMFAPAHFSKRHRLHPHGQKLLQQIHFGLPGIENHPCPNRSVQGWLNLSSSSILLLKIVLFIACHDKLYLFVELLDDVRDKTARI